jgi:hypothetical protein
MMKAALINSSKIVLNIVVWDDQSIAPQGLTAIVLDNDFYVDIGSVYNNDGSWTHPVPLELATESQATRVDLQNEFIAIVSRSSN